MNYDVLLKDPRWQKKRLEIMKRDNFTCQHCGSVTTTLHVHHLYYKKGLMPWEYDNDALITLCQECHKQTHKRRNKRKNESDLVLYRSLLHDKRLTSNDKILLSYLLYSKRNDLGCKNLSTKLGMSRATIYNSINHLKALSIINDALFVLDKTITQNGYFHLRMDLAKEISGKLLIFYSWLYERAQHYNGTIDTFSYKIAELFGEKENNIRTMLCRLAEKGYVKRIETEDRRYGKLKILNKRLLSAQNH